MGEVIAGKGRASWLLESTAAGAEPSGPALSDAEVTRTRGAGSSLAAPNTGLAAFIAATWLASPIVKQRRQQANQTRHPLPTFHRLPRPSSPPSRLRRRAGLCPCFAAAVAMRAPLLSSQSSRSHHGRVTPAFQASALARPLPLWADDRRCEIVMTLRPTAALKHRPGSRLPAPHLLSCANAGLASLPPKRRPQGLADRGPLHCRLCRTELPPGHSPRALAPSTACSFL